MGRRIHILGSARNTIGGLIGVLGWLLRFARLMLVPKATAAPAKSGDGAPAKPEAKPKGKERKQVDLTPLKGKVAETKMALDKATGEANTLREKARGIEAAAKKTSTTPRQPTDVNEHRGVLPGADGQGPGNTGEDAGEGRFVDR